MSGLKIEGDLSQINEKQLEFIKSVIEKRGFNDNKMTIEPFGKAGDNYIANVMRVKVEDGNDSFKMVAKIAPQNELQRKLLFTDCMFRNEDFMYTKILQKFSELEKTHDVDPAERLKFPICYGSCIEGPNEVILLEDLYESNFKMLDRFACINNDCIKSLLKTFARFHSLGFVLKYKEPELFDECKTIFFDVFANMENKKGGEDMMKTMEDSVISIFDSNHHKNLVHGVLDGMHKNLEKTNKIDIESKNSTLQHGDAWNTNFLFAYDGDKVAESVLIDYQTVKIANPVGDLLFLLSVSTDYDSRKKHFYEWIDYYYCEFDKALSQYDLKSSLVYSRDQLDADIKGYGKLEFGHTLFMLGMIVLKSEEAALMKEAIQSADFETAAAQGNAANSKDPETVAIFKKKVVDLINSYDEFGLL